jgi:hypothetical protein
MHAFLLKLTRLLIVTTFWFPNNNWHLCKHPNHLIIIPASVKVNYLSFGSSAPVFSDYLKWSFRFRKLNEITIKIINCQYMA